MEALYSYVMNLIRNPESAIFLIFSIPILILIRRFWFRYGKKFFESGRFSPSELALFEKLLKFYVIAGILVSLIDVPYQLERFLIAPFHIALAAIPVIMAFLIYPKMISKDDGAPKFVETIPVEEAVRKILDSGGFLTALRSALPAGNSSNAQGLDSIPFILHTLDERRKRYEKSSKIFLVTTLVTGGIFILFITGMGYILIDEQSIGTPNTLLDISRSAEGIERDIGLYSHPLLSNPAYLDLKKEVLDGITQHSASAKDDGPKIKRIAARIDSLERSDNFDSLLATLERESKPAQADAGEVSPYDQALNKAYRGILAFSYSKDAAMNRIPVAINELRAFVSKANGIIEQPQNRVAEILKRLILSLVVASFLIAVLKFLSGLYRNHYAQMLSTESDDLLVRKFFVTYQAPNVGVEERNLIIKSFLTRFQSKEPKENANNSAKQEMEIMKELLSTLSKKL
jgi:hypothetical protein